MASRHRMANAHQKYQLSRTPRTVRDPMKLRKQAICFQKSTHRRPFSCRHTLILLVLCLPQTIAAQSQAVAQAIDTQTVAKWNNVRVVDGVKFPRTGAGIQAAIDDLEAAAGTVLLPPGLYSVPAEIRVTQVGVSIIGYGHSSEIRLSDASSNLFNVSGARFLLADLEISTTVRKTAGSIIDATADQGTVRDVRLTGNFWNGFTLDTSKASNWTFEGIRVPGGVTWNYLLHLQTPSGTVASTHLRDLVVSNTIHWNVASLVLDSGVDTFMCSDCELGPVLAQNSLGTQAPRWIRFENTFIEAGVGGVVGGTAVNIQAARDFHYQGYIGTSETGVAVGSGARGIDVSHSEFVNIGRSAVTIAAGAQDVMVDRNVFEDTGNQANGTYDTVSVASGASDFQLTYNIFKSNVKNRPRYDVSVAAGSSDRYQIVGNQCRNFAKSALNDGGTGHARQVSDNQ